MDKWNQLGSSYWKVLVLTVIREDYGSNHLQRDVDGGGGASPPLLRTLYVECSSLGDGHTARTDEAQQNGQHAKTVKQRNDDDHRKNEEVGREHVARRKH